MTRMAGRIGEFYWALVVGAKRRHVADKRGAGAQYSSGTAFFISSFS